MTVQRAIVRAISKQTKTEYEREVYLQNRALAALLRQKEYTYLAGGKVFHNLSPMLPIPIHSFRWNGFGGRRWRVYSKWIDGKHNDLQRQKFDAFVGKSGTTLSQENDDSK